MLLKTLLTLSISFVLTGELFSQENVWRVPDVEIKDLKNNSVSASTIHNLDGPTIISFWATWCKPCILELNTIKDSYIDWQDETNVKLVAISIDDTRNIGKVGPMARGKGWEYDIYIDANSDLRRALNVNNVPHTFLLDKEGNIVWQHNGYASGDEDELYKKVEQVAAGQPLE
jgi:cytochrome c biogenesis protein CcmG, thiol:disulfide interchange protein DsbE